MVTKTWTKPQMRSKQHTLPFVFQQALSANSDRHRTITNVLGVFNRQRHAVHQISHLLSKVREVVTFFHKSTTDAHALKVKQEMLNIPVHKLFMTPQLDGIPSMT